jgi:hypothetical protein
MNFTHRFCVLPIYFQKQKFNLDKAVPEGTGYRARTRFAKFFNLPERMKLFKEAADNMLKITSDGRKLGLDQRIINRDLPDR